VRRGRCAQAGCPQTIDLQSAANTANTACHIRESRGVKTNLDNEAQKGLVELHVLLHNHNAIGSDCTRWTGNASGHASGYWPGQHLQSIPESLQGYILIDEAEFLQTSELEWHQLVVVRLPACTTAALATLRRAQRSSCGGVLTPRFSTLRAASTNVGDFTALSIIV
jgi:hypothetical protein